MGCGASTTTHSAKENEKGDVEVRGEGSIITDKHSMTSERGDENHVKYKENDGKPLRLSRKWTGLEIMFMETIPSLYGEKDSDNLPKLLQEEGQAEVLRKCLGGSSNENEEERRKWMRKLLEDWLHDCPNCGAREQFIENVLEQLCGFSIRQRTSIKEVTDSRKDKNGAWINSIDPGSPILQAHRSKSFLSSCESEKENETSQRTGAPVQHTTDSADSDDESDHNDAEEAEFEAKLLARSLDPTAKKRGSRAAVSGEADINEADDWEPVAYDKTDEQRRRLKDAVSDCFMFAALSEEQLEPIIGAFQEVHVAPQEVVISQGAWVDQDDLGLYVLELGTLAVSKNGSEGFIHQYSRRGEYFGELALLYDAPRAATVTAQDECILWALDRYTFNCLVRSAARKAKEKRLQFLKSMEILQCLNPEELMKIADTLRTCEFAEGEFVIHEGQEGHDFFILESGTAEARKGSERLKEYGAAEYFGELALLNNAPRAASVVTTSRCTILSLDRAAFSRMLGPLNALLQERSIEYKLA